MSSDKLMESVLNLTLFGTEYLFGKLREPVNKTDWVTHGRPAIVNAFYSSIENSIRKYRITSFTLLVAQEYLKALLTRRRI